MERHAIPKFPNQSEFGLGSRNRSRSSGMDTEQSESHAMWLLHYNKPNEAWHRTERMAMAKSSSSSSPAPPSAPGETHLSGSLDFPFLRFCPSWFGHSNIDSTPLQATVLWGERPDVGPQLQCLPHRPEQQGPQQRHHFAGLHAKGSGEADGWV